DVADFVDTVLARLRLLADRDGRPGLVVAAFDTELFGHWWHEGPAWLAAVLRALPAAGVRGRGQGLAGLGGTGRAEPGACGEGRAGPAAVDAGRAPRAGARPGAGPA